MPIEIRELVIRATIVDSKNDDPEAEGEGMTESASTVNQNQIIQECVDQVLKIIKKSKNR